jgi:uncharacterized protein (TIGR02391 family)
MDEALALATLEAFLAELEQNHAIYRSAPSHITPPALPASDAKIRQSLAMIQDIAEELEPRLGNELQEQRGMMSWSWHTAQRGAQRMQGILINRESLAAIIGPTGPQLAATGLHPWVWEAATSLWNDGHYREAVGNAASAIDARLQAKLGRHDIVGTDLVTQAFRTDDPTPDGPRLRFAELEPHGQAWNSQHQGAMAFGRGCFLAIRNPAHHDTDTTAEQEALERLAALSVLARWIDEAEVERGE